MNPVRNRIHRLSDSYKGDKFTCSDWLNIGREMWQQPFTVICWPIQLIFIQPNFPYSVLFSSNWGVYGQCLTVGIYLLKQSINKNRTRINGCWSSVLLIRFQRVLVHRTTVYMHHIFQVSIAYQHLSAFAKLMKDFWT